MIRKSAKHSEKFKKLVRVSIFCIYRYLTAKKTEHLTMEAFSQLHILGEQEEGEIL
jgi:hypothetical protein